MTAKTQQALSPPDWRDLLIAGAFGLAALMLYLWRIADPAVIYFDETHYVPAARELVNLANLPNPEHPPLGKLLIGASMVLFGDNPGGWRTMSAIFGALTVFSGVMASRWLFLRRPAAIMTGALLLFSNDLLSQSRIAMLEVFMLGFLMLAFWILTAWPRSGFPGRWRAVLGGGCLGLAVASKWTAVPLSACGVALLLYLLWHHRKRPDDKQPAIPLREAVGWLGPFALLVYLATFLPYMFLRTHPVSLIGIIPQQLEMLRLQSEPMGSHPYQSVWWQWILDYRPIWYFYEPVASIQRGVLFIGNPAIAWGGLVALLTCLWAGLRDRRQALLVPVLFWAAPLLFFIVAPKPVQFYYHYLVSELMLCFASAAALDHFLWRRGGRLFPCLAIGLAGLVFLEFYPIVSAAALGDPQDFNRWMWLQSWR